MYLFFRIITVVIITFFIANCSFLRFPGAYKVKVQQGNFIEEEMVEQLEIGMNREQVRYIMGTPMIADTFNPDRWDYFYNVQRGNKEVSKYHFKVFFEQGRLARWDGDYRRKDQVMDSITGKDDTKLTKPDSKTKNKDNSSTPEESSAEKDADSL